MAQPSIIVRCQFCGAQAKITDDGALEQAVLRGLKQLDSVGLLPEGEGAKVVLGLDPLDSVCPACDAKGLRLQHTDGKQRMRLAVNAEEVDHPDR